MNPVQLQHFQDSLEQSSDTEQSIIPPQQKKERLAFIRNAALQTKIHQNQTIQVNFSKDYLQKFSLRANSNNVKYELA